MLQISLQRWDSIEKKYVPLCGLFFKMTVQRRESSVVIVMPYIAIDRLINNNNLDDSIDHSPNTIIIAELFGKTFPKCSQLTTGPVVQEKEDTFSWTRSEMLHCTEITSNK